MRCLDTYALVEIADGNAKFTHLLSEGTIVNEITLTEFYGLLYREYDVQTAEYWHKKLSPFCKPVSKEILLKSIIFKVDNSKKNISFFDAVGYIYSRENNVLFVTGDKEFKNFKGVEFITK